jgi:hypothetical protein
LSLLSKSVGAPAQTSDGLRGTRRTESGLGTVDGIRAASGKFGDAAGALTLACSSSRGARDEDRGFIKTGLATQIEPPGTNEEIPASETPGETGPPSILIKDAAGVDSLA